MNAPEDVVVRVRVPDAASTVSESTTAFGAVIDVRACARGARSALAPGFAASARCMPRPMRSIAISAAAAAASGRRARCIKSIGEATEGEAIDATAGQGYPPFGGFFERRTYVTVR